MGRPIDDSIRYLAAMRKTYQADTEVLSMAIDIMHKYQKIQEQAELSEKENHVVDTARMIMIEKIINGEVEDE